MACDHLSMHKGKFLSILLLLCILITSPAVLMGEDPDFNLISRVYLAAASGKQLPQPQSFGVCSITARSKIYPMIFGLNDPYDWIGNKPPYISMRSSLESRRNEDYRSYEIYINVPHKERNVRQNAIFYLGPSSSIPVRGNAIDSCGITYSMLEQLYIKGNLSQRINVARSNELEWTLDPSVMGGNGKLALDLSEPFLDEIGDTAQFRWWYKGLARQEKEIVMARLAAGGRPQSFGLMFFPTTPYLNPRTVIGAYGGANRAIADPVVPLAFGQFTADMATEAGMNENIANIGGWALGLYGAYHAAQGVTISMTGLSASELAAYTYYGFTSSATLSGGAAAAGLWGLLAAELVALGAEVHDINQSHDSYDRAISSINRINTAYSRIGRPSPEPDEIPGFWTSTAGGWFYRVSFGYLGF